MRLIVLGSIVALSICGISRADETQCFFRIKSTATTHITALDASGVATWSNELVGGTCIWESASSLTAPWGEFAPCLVTGTVMSLRLVNIELPRIMIPVPAGNFEMGNCMDGEGGGDELPVRTVYVSAFSMDQDDVTKEQWDAVYNWALAHGYDFYGDGSAPVGQGKGADHPVQTVNWYDCVKWCNARSEMEGQVPAYYTSEDQSEVYRTGQIDLANGSVKWQGGGYRLPTEAEWEKAARGGTSGHRFPWSDSDMISWDFANYWSLPCDYDANPLTGNNPIYDDYEPFTSPMKSFPANGYGVYDMAGNVTQWCWDRYGSYSPGDTSDPHGPASSDLARVSRGGSWIDSATGCRVAARNSSQPTIYASNLGFRAVRSAQ